MAVAAIGVVNVKVATPASCTTSWHVPALVPGVRHVVTSDRACPFPTGSRPASSRPEQQPNRSGHRVRHAGLLRHCCERCVGTPTRFVAFGLEQHPVLQPRLRRRSPAPLGLLTVRAPPRCLRSTVAHRRCRVRLVTVTVPVARDDVDGHTCRSRSRRAGLDVADELAPIARPTRERRSVGHRDAPSPAFCSAVIVNVCGVPTRLVGSAA